MDIVSICAVCLMTSVICRLLSKDSGEMSSALSIITVIIIGTVIIFTASDVLAIAKSIYDTTNADREYFNILAKGAGICIITKTAADCCRDCGESALASASEAAGRVSLLIVALPLFSGVMTVVEELMS